MRIEDAEIAIRPRRSAVTAVYAAADEAAMGVVVGTDEPTRRLARGRVGRASMEATARASCSGAVPLFHLMLGID